MGEDDSSKGETGNSYTRPDNPTTKTKRRRHRRAKRNGGDLHIDHGGFTSQVETRAEYEEKKWECVPRAAISPAGTPHEKEGKEESLCVRVYHQALAIR